MLLKMMLRIVRTSIETITNKYAFLLENVNRKLYLEWSKLFPINTRIWFWKAFPGDFTGIVCPSRSLPAAVGSCRPCRVWPAAAGVFSTVVAWRPFTEQYLCACMKWDLLASLIPRPHTRPNTRSQTQTIDTSTITHGSHPQATSMGFSEHPGNEAIDGT